MTIFVSLFVAIVGALMWIICANDRLQKIGLVSFGCGLVVFLLQLSPKVIDFLGR